MEVFQKNSKVSTMVQRYTGFTLAEVLIVIGIIGIIANMTIPSLVKGINDQELKAAWKKNYSVISQATALVMSDNGGGLNNLCTSNDDDCLAAVYSKYLIAIKSCAHGTSGCFYNDGELWRHLSGAVMAVGMWSADSGAILKDGSILNYEYWDSTCNTGAVFDCGRIIIDVNGRKLPNTMGKDIFSVHLQKNKVSPYGVSGDGNEADCVTSPPSGNGWGCSAKYLYQ